MFKPSKCNTLYFWMTAKCGHGFDEWPLALVPETELFMFWNSVLVYNINMCLVDFILYKEGGYHG